MRFRLFVATLTAALVAALVPAAAAVELPGDDVVSLPLGGDLTGGDEDLYVIPLASGDVDPLRDWPQSDPQGEDLVLVQFVEFGATAMVDAVAGTGARLVQPLAPVNYLVWADAVQTQAIRGLDGVRFAGVLPASARVSASVDADTALLRVTLVGPAGLAGTEASVRPRTFTDVSGAVVEVEGGVARARELAQLPRVYSVADAGGRPQLRDEKSAQVVAAGTDNGVRPGYGQFLQRYGADGTGVLVSHVDGGVDFNHPELSDRVAACIGYGTDGPVKCELKNHDDAIGHGTHTLGIVMGTGSLPLSDVDGFRYGQGVAPGAKAIVQNAIHTGAVNADPFADGYRPVYRQAQDLGAIVSQNSWGPSGSPQGYDQDTREFDTIVRDADETEPGDQPLALVFSIMNGLGGTSTQGSPDEGKNIIGVGATGNRGVGAPGVDDLCYCTAHGPALDGRLLPDLVAPGQQVISTRAAQGTLCGTPGIGYPPDSPSAEVPPSPFHAGCTGTSMASPHVSGGYAVFVDWYRERHGGRTPSPALVKAAFINGADDLAGGKDADGNTMGHIPDNKQGWGRFNLGNVLGAWERGAVHVDQQLVFDATGNSHTVRVEPIDPTKPLKASLVWTDAPGPGLGDKTPGWVNDLDLRVTAPTGVQYLGNVFASGMSVPGGPPDRMNNVENVYLAAPAAGGYTVTVAAANIIGDGLPNSGDATDQDFALVITNARLATS